VEKFSPVSRCIQCEFFVYFAMHCHYLFSPSSVSFIVHFLELQESDFLSYLEMSPELYMNMNFVKFSENLRFNVYERIFIVF
jgi:hypothetical protein